MSAPTSPPGFPFSGTATEAGWIYADLGGTRIAVPIAVGETASEVVAALAAVLGWPPDNFGQCVQN